MNEIPVIREGGKDPDEERQKNLRVGCGAVLFIAAFVPAVIIAIPLVAALYRWAFGG